MKTLTGALIAPALAASLMLSGAARAEELKAEALIEMLENQSDALGPAYVVGYHAAASTFTENEGQRECLMDAKPMQLGLAAQSLAAGVESVSEVPAWMLMYGAVFKLCPTTQGTDE